MKRVVIAALLLCVTSVSAIGAGDILQQLGFSKTEAGKEIAFAFGTGMIAGDNLKAAFKPASPAARAALVEQVLVWTKAYVASPDFEREYQEFRNNYKPEEPGTDGNAEDIRYARERYNEDLAQWKQEYPATGRAMVKRRLQEFLNETADVDYSAKLVRCGRKMCFANEDYESKSGEWKASFRAGKEPVEKARTFAKAWIAELK